MEARLQERDQIKIESSNSFVLNMKCLHQWDPPQLRVMSTIYIALVITGSALANHSKRDFSCLELVLVMIVASPSRLTSFKICGHEHMCVGMYNI